MQRPNKKTIIVSAFLLVGILLGVVSGPTLISYFTENDWEKAEREKQKNNLSKNPADASKQTAALNQPVGQPSNVSAQGGQSNLANPNAVTNNTTAGAAVSGANSLSTAQSGGQTSGPGNPSRKIASVEGASAPVSLPGAQPGALPGAGQIANQAPSQVQGAGQVQSQQAGQLPAVSGQTPANALGKAKTQTAPVEEKPVIKAEISGCYSVTYFHKKISSHSDGEACMRHNNLIKLQHAVLSEPGVKVTSDSVCILVNELPVNFTKVKGKDNEFVFGPIAGPNAKVTARFCVGKSKCNEKCVVKKDEFMDALGVDENDVTSAVGWDGSKDVAKEEKDLESEASALGKEKQSADRDNKVFSDWLSEASSTACNGNTVSKGKAITHAEKL